MSAQPVEFGHALDVYAQYEALTAIMRGASAQLRRVWLAGPTDPAEFVAYLMDVLPDLAAAHRAASATLAADWYDELREILSPRGRFAATVQSEVPSARLEASIRWAVDPLYRPDAHSVDSVDLMSGSWDRLVADAHRETIAFAVEEDDAAVGWARYGRGGCGFCRMLIDRGAVYTSASAGFASHDRCRCIAGPSFKDAEAVSAYVPTTRRLSDKARAARNKAAREWIAANLT